MIKLLLLAIIVTILQSLYLPNHKYSEVNNSQQKIYQYMAICTDGDGVLSPWMDNLDAANKFGKDHEVSTKGHRWRIETREKPQLPSDTTNRIIIL